MCLVADTAKPQGQITGANATLLAREVVLREADAAEGTYRETETYRILGYVAHERKGD